MNENVLIGPYGRQYTIAYTEATFREMAEKYNAIIAKSGTIEDLNSVLSQYPKVPCFIHNLFRSKYYYSIGDLSKASRFMDLVLQSLESNDEGVQSFMLYRNPSLQWIYGNAGEIYANNGEYEKALQSYQDYELTLARISSCDVSEGLLSFRSINEHTLSDLINNEITVCSPRVMNDPYDTLLIKWGDNIRLTKSEKKHVRPLCDSFESYRIRSFCHLSDKLGRETISNVLMWAHYANEHKGVCIKYKFSPNFVETVERRTTRFREIIYHDRDIPFDLNSSSIDTDQALCTKLKDWEYENEVRLITYIPDVAGYYYSIPLDDNSFIDSIYFGYRCADDTIRTVRNALRAYPDIHFFKMNSDYRDIYKLRATQL